jgi:ATP-dependent helicase/DNAse subunit B
MEMLRNFAAFIEAPQARLAGWESQIELKFNVPVHPGLAINGRIDRLERNARGEALVIDYKYSAPERLRERIAKSEAGEAVQAGLYLLAAERQFGLRPAGMLFCALKKVGWEGWHLSLEGYAGAGSTCTAEALRELIDTATRSTAEAHERILSGHIAVQPADTKHCRWCDYRDACRIETVAAARGAGA